jgi:ATP-dependent RNA helicase RhlE
VRTKRGADRLVKKLGAQNVHAVAMHGDKSQSQREKALARFESGKVDTLVATDVAARGIDVSGVTHVINYDAPAAREDYVHRIGRTARAGASGVGITFVLDDQAREVAKFADELGLEHGLGVAAPAARPRPQGGGSAGGRNRRRRRPAAR